MPKTRTDTEAPETSFISLGALAITLSVALYLPVVWWIYRRFGGPAPHLAELKRQFLFAGEFLKPEPAEKNSYLAALFLFPILIFAFVQGFSRLPFPFRRLEGWIVFFCPLVAWIALRKEELLIQHNFFYTHPIVTGAVALALLRMALGSRITAAATFSFGLTLWALFLVSASSLYDNTFYFWFLPFPGITLFLFRVFEPQWKISFSGKTIEKTMAIALLVIIFLFGIFTELRANIHFIALFSSVVQVHLGKVLLGDFQNLYGLYPHFLAPIFKIIGLSVFKFTLVTSFLLVTSYFLLWMTLRRVVKLSWLATLGLFALFSNHWFMFLLLNRREYSGNYDPYLQYYPLRVLFPALIIFFAVHYFSKRTWQRYWITTFLSAAAILWNQDSGVVVFGAWMVVLGYDAWLDRRTNSFMKASALHSLRLVGALVLILSAWEAWFWISSGKTIHWAQFVDYLPMYFGSGYYMLPMLRVGSWMAVGLLYLIGLAYAVGAADLKQTPEKARLILLVSILGCGLFSYHQGRSHPYTLIAVAWPAVLLLVLFLDDLLSSIETRLTAPRVMLAGVLLFFLTGSALTIFHEGSFLFKQTYQNLVIDSKIDPPLVEEAKFISETLGRSDNVLVLSHEAALINLHVGRSLLPHRSLIETLLTKDYEDLNTKLSRYAYDRVFIDEEFEKTRTRDPVLEKIMRTLETKYHVLGASPSGRFKLLGGPAPALLVNRLGRTDLETEGSATQPPSP
jgi:hypothetical protein